MSRYRKRRQKESIQRNNGRYSYNYSGDDNYDDDEEKHFDVEEDEDEIVAYENGNLIKLDESTSKRNVLHVFDIDDDDDDYVDPYLVSDDDDDISEDPDYSPEEVEREMEFIRSIRRSNISQVKNKSYNNDNKEKEAKQPTRLDVIRERSFKSIGYTWNENTSENEFHYVNNQEEAAILIRPEYLNLETLIGTQKSVMRKKKKGVNKDQSSKNIYVADLIECMKKRGYEFIKEPLDLRTGLTEDSNYNSRNNNNNNRRQYHNKQQQRYRYYRLKSDGIIVIVANIETNNYVGHFYAPRIIDQVASTIEATYRNSGFVKKN